MIYVYTHVLRFPVNTIIAWIINDYHEQGNIIITNLLLPLGHISNTMISDLNRLCYHHYIHVLDPILQVIVTQLHCDVWYTQSTSTVSGSYMISWSKEEILDIGKALEKRTTRSCAMLRIGSCPSHHSPNDVIPLSKTSNVHSQETMTIC